MASNVSAISWASYEREPLNKRCSMKCDTPARSGRSSREPAPIQNPSDTERTLGTFSEITRSPESNSDSTYFCIGRWYSAGTAPCALRERAERSAELHAARLRHELEAGARALRLVERLVRQPEERLRVAGVLGARGDAEARTRSCDVVGDALHDLARLLLPR